MTKRKMLFISRMLAALGLLLGGFAATSSVAFSDSSSIGTGCGDGSSY